MQLQVSLLVHPQEATLNLLPPFDALNPVRFFPGGVESESVEELSDPDGLDGPLLGLGGFEINDGSQV